MNNDGRAPNANERYNLRPRRRAAAPPPNEAPVRERRGAARRGRRAARPVRRRRPEEFELPPARRRRLQLNPIRLDINMNLDPHILPPRFIQDIEPWPWNVDIREDLMDVPDDDTEEDDDGTDEDDDGTDDDDDSDNDSTSSNEPMIPLFRIPEGDDEDEEDADYDPEDGDNNIIWHPFEPFAWNMDGGGNLNNFMDVFRRIARGLDTTRNTFHLDTLPPPRPLDLDRLDLYKSNLPPRGSLPQYRNFMIPPFTNCMVDSLPPQTQRRHIFLTNYTRDCWSGLQEKAKQCELRSLKSKIWCTVETAKMIKRYYPLLHLEIQDLLHTLVPNRLYQILPDESADRLSVVALSLDSIPGACMYLLCKDNKFFLHTGSNAGQDNYTASMKKIKEWTTSIDVLYLDSALYFPGENESFRQKLDTQSSSLKYVKEFMNTMVQKEEHQYFFSIQFCAGMEKFMLDIISWVDMWKVGMTKDLYEQNYAEIIDHREKVLKIDYLDMHYLNQHAREHAHIFFYSEEHSDFHHLNSTNENHIKLRVIYDYHSSIERIREPRCCSNAIYRKCRAFTNDSDEELTYYVLYPTHPVTQQVKNMIKVLKPERIFALSRAPGVTDLELREDFKRLIETQASRRSSNRRIN